MSSRIVLAVAVVLAAARPACAALDKRNDPIDPTKRAPISTSDAVRPAATMPAGNGVVGDGRVPTPRASVPASSVSTPQASIVVSETREKQVRKPGVRKASASPVRTKDMRKASDLPASIPRLDRRGYEKTLTEYREGARRASDMTHHRVQVGDQTVDLSEINRFASPRATLEQQGIPVVPAGEQAPAGSGAAPVPIPASDAAPTR